MLNPMLVWESPPPVSEKLVPKLFALCNVTSTTNTDDFRLLDFGCGEGRYLRAFSQRIPKRNLYGMEVISDRVAQVARQEFHAVPLATNSSVLSFNSNTFDAVFSADVVEHIPNELYLDYLHEIRRILKPGGRFVVATPNYPSKRIYDMRKAYKTKYTRYYLLDDPTHCNKLSIDTLQKDLEAVFSEVQLEPSGFFLENKVTVLQNPSLRQKFKRFSDKIIGYAVK